jgi:ubiquinone/menaquinone biosynthesis C-methylase UbiE
MMIESKERINKSFSGKGVFPYKFAFTLLIPFRNIFLSRKELIKRLELKNDLKVLEVGPGPGYFSIKIAKEIFKGKLVLADIQQEMLDYAKKRIDKKGFNNVDYYLCNGLEFNFPDFYFDRIFLVTVIGEVENKEIYFTEFYRMLKFGGILSISEIAGDPDKMESDEIKEFAKNVGFKFYKFYGNEKNYTINFQKVK